MRNVIDYLMTCLWTGHYDITETERDPRTHRVLRIRVRCLTCNRTTKGWTP